MSQRGEIGALWRTKQDNVLIKFLYYAIVSNKQYDDLVVIIIGAV